MLTNKIKDLEIKEREAKAEFESSISTAEQPTPTDLVLLLEKVNNFVMTRKENEFARMRTRQVNKLEKLILEKNSRNQQTSCPEHQEKWVRNLSKYSLSDAERSVLAKGLKFAITPEKTPTDQYIVSTELACRGLPPQEADQLRCEVVQILSGNTTPK